jgi:uncharacterized protein YrzB (UPF0473 family)
MADELEDEIQIFTLVDEDGEEEDFAVVTIVDLPEGRFAVLTQAEAMFAEDGEDELELYVFHYGEDEEGEAQLDPVEDDALVEKILEIVDQQLGGDGEE